MKRGEISLSFSFILAIIIIGVVIAVGFYMVSYFLGLKNCTELGLFKRDLQTKIDDAWNSEETMDSFSAPLPNGVKKVCFGNLSQGRNFPEYDELSRFDEPGANLFYYPIPSGNCDITYGALKHVRFSGFKCVAVESGKATLGIVKGTFDSTVLVCDPRASTCDLSSTSGAPSGSPLNNLPGQSGTPAPLVSISQSWCDVAERDNLCEGLAIASQQQDYKTACCTQYGRCCT